MIPLFSDSWRDWGELRISAISTAYRIPWMFLLPNSSSLLELYKSYIKSSIYTCTENIWYWEIFLDQHLKDPWFSSSKGQKIFAIIIPVSEISPQCFSISRLCNLFKDNCMAYSTESYFFSRKVHKWDPLQV